MKLLRPVLLITILIVLFIGMNSCSDEKSWVAKIDGKTITIEDFNVRFEYYLKSKYFQQPDRIPIARNSMEERKTALRDMIHERLILEEAKKIKIHEKDEIKDMIKLYTQQIILNAYIEQNLAGSINVDEKAIDEYYKANRNKFRHISDPEQVKRLIKRELSMRQYEEKLKEIIDKLKNKYRIVENENLIRPIVGTNVLQGRGDEDTGAGAPVPATPKRPKVKVKPLEPKKELPGK